MSADSNETLLARIDERTENIDRKLTAHCDQLNDHERRINCIEGFRQTVYILCAVAVALAGLAAAAGYFHA
jgi:hypothetical protein